MLAYWAPLHVMEEHTLQLVSLYQVSFDFEAGTVMVVLPVDAPRSHPAEIFAHCLSANPASAVAVIGSD